MGAKNSAFLGSETSVHTTKFNIFLKTHEIKQVNKALKSVLLMSRNEREEWLAENGEIVQTAFDSFIDDSNLVLESLTFDEDLAEMSQELILSLQNTMEIVNSILGEEQVLDS